MGQTCTRGSDVVDESAHNSLRKRHLGRKSKDKESSNGRQASSLHSDRPGSTAKESTRTRTPPPAEFLVVKTIEALLHTMNPTKAIVPRGELHSNFRQFTPINANGCAALAVVSCQNASLSQQVLIGGEDCGIAQFSYETGHVMRRWVGAHRADIVGLTRPTATGLFASCSRDCTAKVWNLNRDTPIAVLEGHTLGVSAVDMDSSNAHIATGSRDNSVRLWDIGSAKELFCSVVQQNVPTFVRFLPQLRLVAQGSEDLAVRLWDVRVPPSVPVLTLNEVMRDTSYIPLCCDTSPSAPSRLLTGHSGNDGHGGHVQEWDVRIARSARIYTGHESSVTCLRVSTSKLFGDTTFFTASKDGTMGFWSMESSPSTLDTNQLPVNHQFAVPEGTFTAIECEDNGDVIATLYGGSVIVFRPEERGGAMDPSKRFRYVGTMGAERR